ncbi:7-carboxy-7-deazaguanine synthase QueE [Bacteroidota bacterium]
MAEQNNIEIINGKCLPLIDDFNTIQGEGYYTGKPAYFIRLGGCDSACSWCDTKVLWDPDIHDLVSIDEILKRSIDYKAQNLVVTGGEPSKYNLQPLCELFKAYNINTFVETAGTHNLTGEWKWICLSPKKHAPPVEDIYKMAHELKVVVFNEEDFLWAEETAEKVNKNCKLFLQPEWSRHKKMIALIVDYVKNNPKWRISIQAHKFMGIP